MSHHGTKIERVFGGPFAARKSWGPGGAGGGQKVYRPRISDSRVLWSGMAVGGGGHPHALPRATHNPPTFKGGQWAGHDMAIKPTSETRVVYVYVSELENSRRGLGGGTPQTGKTRATFIRKPEGASGQ